jgi:crossover junction endodeoxyribonuclease RuvC
MKSNKQRRILGIDPGLGRMGYGVIEETREGYRAIDFGCLTTSTRLPKSQRLLSLDQNLKKLFHRYKPHVVAVEEMVFVQNVTTGLAVAEARGVVLLAAAGAGLPVVDFLPTAIKMATVGYGRAEKKQVQIMVAKILGLKRRPTSDDAADALAVALTAAATLSSF